MRAWGWSWSTGRDPPLCRYCGEPYPRPRSVTPGRSTPTILINKVRDGLLRGQLHRSGYKIRNFQPPELAPARMTAAAEAHTRAFPNNVVRRLSATYNCLGLVFANRRTVIEDEHIRDILREDGYRQLSQPDEVTEGDVVVYLDRQQVPCHVGLVCRRILDAGTDRTGIKVLSQWGQDGEYLHDAEDVPDLLGKPSEFWTDREGNDDDHTGARRTILG